MDGRYIAGRGARYWVARWARRLGRDGLPALWAELDHWPASSARFWWRDDDAVADSPALARLLSLRARYGVPLALAVIPAGLNRSLADALHAMAPQELGIMPHGWDHTDHNAPNGPKAELAAHRSPAEVTAQLTEGMARLRAMFGGAALPVLVPPFNCLAPGLATAVRRAGCRYVSVDRDFTGLALRSVNVHADVIDWRGPRVTTPQAIAGGLVAALRLRRLGLVCRSAPLGIMTHHLVHDEAIWMAVDGLLAGLTAHPAVRFPPITELFSQV